MILTYKYRLKDNHAKMSLRQVAWAVNQVWNFCVATQHKVQVIRKQGFSRRWPSKYDLHALTKSVSGELGIHAQTVQGVCEQFTRSRDAHKKCPHFRASTGPRRSLGWVPFRRQSRQLDGNSITYLGHRFLFFGAKRRPLPAVTKGGTFVEDARGKWWVCFHVDVGGLPTGASEVGIDLGLKTLATCSDGEKIANPTCFHQLEAKLATVQRASNRVRAKAIHAKIANQRRDYLHKASAKLASANRLIVVGNVNAAGLAKTRMAKSVYDAGWSTFRNMLAYKARRHQARFLEVDERFTTQTCSHCGDSASAGRPQGIAGLGIRSWSCSACGASHDRDVNAAQNILRIGLSAQPPAGESGVNCLKAIDQISTR